MEKGNSKSLPSTAGKNRELWIDVLRGITMLLVVYSHVCGTRSDLNSYFITTRMPLFFFISGFFIYSVEYDYSLLWRRLKNRLTKQLYPTIILFCLFVLLFCKCRLSYYFFDEYKAGYWFTYTSVLYFLTLAPLLVLFHKLRINSAGRILVFLGILILSGFIQDATTHLFKIKFWRLLSFQHYITYLRYLVAGCIFRILWNKYDKKLMRWSLFVVSIIGFMIFNVYASILWESLTSFCGIYFMLFLIYKLTAHCYESKILGFFSFIGSMTLEIYLLHYFVLWAGVYNLPFYKNLLQTTTNTPWEFPLVFIISLSVALISLLIVFVLRKLNIYRFIFWKK